MSLTSLKYLIPDSLPKKKKKRMLKRLEVLEEMSRDLRIASYSYQMKPLLFKKNREKLVGALRGLSTNCMVLLKGSSEKKTTRYENKKCFVQDPYFYWTFGVMLPDIWGAVDIDTGTSYLFYNAFVQKSEIFCHLYDTPENMAAKYEIDKVLSSLEMKLEIITLNRSIIHVLDDMNGETMMKSSPNFVISALAECDPWFCNSMLTYVINHCRATKTQLEYDLIEMAMNLNNEAMMFVILHLRPGLQCFNAADLFVLYLKSSFHEAETARIPICLTGDGICCVEPERAQFFMTEPLAPGSLCILDMGVALRGYRTNIVSTVPVSGRFTKQQALIYRVVFKMRKAVLGATKPGIVFGQLRSIAHQTMISEFKLNNIFDGSREGMLESGLCDLFNPNGIGHLIGTDFYEGEDPSKLNERNCYYKVLEPGMIIALNTEIYMNENVINSRMKTSEGSYIEPVIKDYFGIVVRIQDMVTITLDSKKVISNVPRSLSQIVEVMGLPENILFKFPYPPKRVEGRAELDRTMEEIRKKRGGRRHSWEILDRRLEKQASRTILERCKKIEAPTTKYNNKVMEAVYSYPYKPQNLIDRIMISLSDERRTRNFLPYPKRDLRGRIKTVKYPEEGFGCPHYGWVENPSTCDEDDVFCEMTSALEENQDKVGN